MYSTRTATVTVTCVDILLTEGGRGESGSTCTVHVPPQLRTVNYADTLTEGAMHSVCGYSVT